MAVSTKSNLNSLFSDIFEDALFVARETNIMSSLVTVYNARGWMSRKISQWAQVTAEAVSEGVDFANPTTLSKSVLATLTPGEIMSQVILTDIMVDTDPDDTRRAAAQELGNSIATKIDKDLVGDFSSFTTDVGPGANSTATIAKFAKGVSVLRNNLVPNPIYVVAHPLNVAA